MISHAYWQSRFGGDPRVLGQTFACSAGPRPIVGVLPPGFHFPGNTDLWFPADTITRDNGDTAHEQLLAVGKLKADVALEQAQTEMTSIAATPGAAVSGEQQGPQRRRDALAG